LDKPNFPATQIAESKSKSSSSSTKVLISVALIGCIFRRHLVVENSKIQISTAKEYLENSRSSLTLLREKIPDPLPLTRRFQGSLA
jgi:hypothetical protein